MNPLRLTLSLKKNYDVGKIDTMISKLFFFDGYFLDSFSPGTLVIKLSQKMTYLKFPPLGG